MITAGAPWWKPVTNALDKRLERADRRAGIVTRIECTTISWQLAMVGAQATEGLRLGRPKQALITREAAIKAALATIDDEGLENFSLNSVAGLMGIKAPSLYYHFQDKAELLAGVARLVLIDTDYREIGEGTWEDSTITLCIRTRRALLKHPNAAPLILQFFPRHLLLGAYEQAVAGYPHTRSLHMAILEGIEKLTFGSALFAAAAGTAGIPAMPEVDAVHYPNLAESVAANPFDDEDTFVEALRMLLAGVRLRTQAQAS